MPNDNLARCSLDTPEAILSLTFAVAIMPVYLITSALVWKRRHTFPLVGLHVPLLIANSFVAAGCLVTRAVLFICWADEGTPCGLEFIVLQSTIVPYMLIMLIRGIKLLFKFEITHHLQAVSLKLQEREEEKNRIAGEKGSQEDAGDRAAGTNAWASAGSLVRSFASSDRPAPSSSLLRLQAASSPQARSPASHLKSGSVDLARKPEKPKGRLSFNVEGDTQPQPQPPNKLVAPESSMSRQRPNTIEQLRGSSASGEPLSPGSQLASPTTGGRPRAGSAAVSPVAVPSAEPHGVAHFRPVDVEADGTAAGGGSLDGSPNGSPQFSPNHRPPALSNPTDSPLDSQGANTGEPGSPSSLRVTQRYASLDAEAVAAHQDTRIAIAAAALETTRDDTALVVAPDATEGDAETSPAAAPVAADGSSDDDLTLLYSGSSGWFVRHRKLVDRKHLILMFLNAHVGAAGLMLLLSYWDPDTAMYGGGWTDTEIGHHLFSSPVCTFMCVKQWLIRALMLLAIPLILAMWFRLKTKEADAFGLFHFMASSAVIGILAIATYCVFLAFAPKWSGPSTVLFQLALFCVSDIKPLVASYTSSKERRRAFAAASAASRTGSLAAGGGGGGSEGAVSLRLKQFYRLRQVLRHPRSSAAFEAFTQKEFSSENVCFYRETKKFIALATSLEQALPEWPRLGEDAHAPIAGIDQSRRKPGGGDGFDESDAGASNNDGSVLGGEGSTLGGRSLLRLGAGSGARNCKHHGPQEAAIIEMTATPSSPATNAHNKAKSKYKPSARAVAVRPTSAIAEHAADEDADAAADSAAPPLQHVTIHVTQHVRGVSDVPVAPTPAGHARYASLAVVAAVADHHRNSSLTPSPRHRQHVASVSQYSSPEQQQQQVNGSPADAEAPKDVSRSPSLKGLGAATASAAAPATLSLMRTGLVPADYSAARIAQLRDQAMETRRAAITIYKQFIVRGSPFEVNVPHDLQGDIKAQIALLEEWQPVADEKTTATAATGATTGAPKVLALPSPPPLALSALYRPALVCIFDLMQRDSFRRFVVSPLFAAMMVDLEAELVADQKLKQEAAEAAATEAVTRTRLAEENSAILDQLEREAKAAKAGGTPLAASRTPLALRRGVAAVAPSTPLPGSPSVVGGANSRLGVGAERELHLLKSSPVAGSGSPRTPLSQSRNGKPSQQAPSASTPQRSGLRSVHLQPSAPSSVPGSPGGGWASPSVVALHAVAEDSGLGGPQSLQRESDGGGSSGTGSAQGVPGAASARELEVVLAPSHDAADASVSGSSRTVTPQRPGRSPALMPAESPAARPVTVGASA